MTKTPVIAVVPAYNSAMTLPTLLDELVRQKYDKIFVIDDHSTDDTVKVVKSYGSEVNLIEGQENVGSGANRNRIIGKTDHSILHFIDADMQLLSKNTPEIIRSFSWEKDTAYIGGLIRNPDGEQNPFNFGPRASLLTTIESFFQYGIWFLGLRFKRAAKILQLLFWPLLHEWPNIYTKAKIRETHWTAESNMVIRSQTYEQLGGYDPIFRYGEVNDFGLRLERLGLKTYFDPRIDTLHANLDNILYRASEKSAAHKQYLKKHGRLTWLLPWLSNHLEGRKTQKRYHK